MARVRELAPRDEIERRYDQINRFEKSLADDGTTVIKGFLHISFQEQRRRLVKRLDRPDKHWKFSPSDIDDRALWPAFQEALLLLEHLRELDPRYPKPDFDVAQCRRMVARAVNRAGRGTRPA